MAWRKWMVRGIVYGILGACVLAALLYQRWTNPGAVREQIIAKLSEVFPGTQVSVDSARLRILGGIELNGLRLVRADDPEKHEFLQIPSAIFYHDKEKILDGELTLRKIELIRPRLRLRRGRDGAWNVRGLFRPPAAAQAAVFPAIVIHQGTLILEDRSEAAKAPSLEINDVSLTIINDPLPIVRIRGSAESEWLGKVQVQGHLNRADDEAYVTFNASRIPLTPALAARFQLPGQLLTGLQLRAAASVKGQVSYHPHQAQPWYYDVHCEVQEGTVQHPRLPWEKGLEDLHARIHCQDGELTLETLTARAGTTELEAKGSALLPNLEKNFEVQLDLKHVKLGEDLAARLPDKIRNLHQLFKPAGPTTIHVACAQREGQWVALSSGEPSQVSLRPEGISLAFKEFSYPLQRAAGAVDYNIADEHVKVRLIAYAAGQPILLKGDWHGEGQQADVDFDIKGDNIPIEDKLVKALPESLRDLVKSFHATGKVNVTAHIGRKPGDTKFRNEYHIAIHDATICWDNFPLRLNKVSGNLDIYPDHWEFHEFQGMHNDGHVLMHGQSTPRRDEKKGEENHGITLEITGRNIPLGDDLRDALRTMKGLHNAWTTFDPRGRLYFTAAVDRPTSDINDLDVRVDARGCSVQPAFFPYLIQDLSGQFRFHHSRLEISNLRARHDQALIALNRGTVDLHPSGGGGYYADLLDVQARGIRLDDEFVQALPRGKLQEAVKCLHLSDPLRVHTRLVIAQAPETGKPPDVYWDGKVEMFGAKLTTGLELSNVTGEVCCVGRHNGRQILGAWGHAKLDHASVYNQPFTGVHAKFQIQENTPDLLLIGLRAPIFGGDITGQVRVDFYTPLRFELNLTASQLSVAEGARHNLGPKSQLAGTASARLYLKGMGTSGMESLEGNGAIDIPRGHFYNLPLLLDLLKFLGLHWPDRTAFEEFHTAYNIQGPKVNVQQFDLLGSALSLSGKGEYDLQSKNLQLEVYPMWGRVEQLLPSPVRPFPTAVSKNLLTVEVKGKLGSDLKDMKYQMKPVPILFDPLLLLRDRILGLPASTAASPGHEPVPTPAPPPQITPMRNSSYHIWE